MGRCSRPAPRHPPEVVGRCSRPAPRHPSEAGSRSCRPVSAPFLYGGVVVLAVMLRAVPLVVVWCCSRPAPRRPSEVVGAVAVLLRAVPLWWCGAVAVLLRVIPLRWCDAAAVLLRCDVVVVQLCVVAGRRQILLLCSRSRPLSQSLGRRLSSEFLSSYFSYRRFCLLRWSFVAILGDLVFHRLFQISSSFIFRLSSSILSSFS